MLTITEDLFLITLHERKNSITPSLVPAVPYALVSAMFVDLITAGKVRLVEERRVLVVDASSSGSRYLDMILDTLQVAPRPKKLTYWLSVFGTRGKRLQRALFAACIEKGLITNADDQYAWTILCPGEVQRTASIKFLRKQRLRGFVLGGEPADERTVITLYLLNTFGLLDGLFTPDEIKLATRRLREQLKMQGDDAPLFHQIDEISTAAAIASAMGNPV